MYNSDEMTIKDSNSIAKKLIALTFDDGPSNITNQVLDKLQKYNIVASFFLVGNLITEESKNTIQRELDIGCEVCNHSWSHPVMSQMSKAEIMDEFQKTNEAIYNITGAYPKFFRPPYIAISDTMFEVINLPFIRGLGCTDWEPSVSAQQRAQTILNNAEDGEIVLLHDAMDNIQTVEALDAIIQGLLENGFTFVTVSQLFEQKGIDPNVEYKLWTNVINQ